MAASGKAAAWAQVQPEGMGMQCSTGTQTHSE